MWKPPDVLNFFDLKPENVLKMFLFLAFFGILAEFSKKLHVLRFVKAKNFLKMFLTFWPLKPYVLIFFVLI